MTTEPPIYSTLIELLQNTTYRQGDGEIALSERQMGYNAALSDTIAILRQNGGDKANNGIFDQPWPGEPGHYHTPDPDLQRREISDVREFIINQLVLQGPNNITPFNEREMLILSSLAIALSPYLRTTEPVSVARCVAVMKSSHYSVESQAKACLDTAKAQGARFDYVD